MLFEAIPRATASIAAPTLKLGAPLHPQNITDKHRAKGTSAGGTTTPSTGFKLDIGTGRKAPSRQIFMTPLTGPCL